MSTVINGYCTLAEFKAHLTPPGETLDADTADDAVIHALIETASRRVDDLTGRVFYPYVQTRSYDIPTDGVLWLDADLLEVTTLTNGDDDAIASTEYVLQPANVYPKYSLRIRDVSSEVWEVDSNASSEQVIDVLGVWGYHNQYSVRGWKAAGTLAAAWASTTTLTATMTAGHTLDVQGGEVIKIDNELYNVASVVANTLTVLSRGDNGSTAATHLINAPVYVWTYMRDIKELALEVTKIMYRSRYGENVETTSTYTASGVIVTPRSLPVWAQEIIRRYQRLV